MNLPLKVVAEKWVEKRLNKPSLDLNNKSDNSLLPAGYNKFIIRDCKRTRERENHVQNETFWQVPAASVNVTHSDSWFSTKETLCCQWSWNSEESLERLLKKKFEYLACVKVEHLCSSSSSRFTYIESAAVRKLGHMIFFHFFFGNDEPK